jgi:acetyltransferase-like isoleucine patch superfamily enzyme
MMVSPGVRPVSVREVSHPARAAVAALPSDAGQALRRLRRGPLVTSSLWPLAVRRTLLRLGGVRLGPVVWGLERCWFESEHVSIGPGSAVNAACWFEGRGPIIIGRDCFIGPEVMIVTSIHALSGDGQAAREPSYGEVRVGDRSWLGARALIMPGVTIGEGTIIGAGAVVTKDCEPGAVYAGVPARRVR